MKRVYFSHNREGKTTGTFIDKDANRELLNEAHRFRHEFAHSVHPRPVIQGTYAGCHAHGSAWAWEAANNLRSLGSKASAADPSH